MTNEPVDKSNLFNRIVKDRQFNFQPLEFGRETAYHVDVKDAEGTRWEFRMSRAGEKSWKIEGENLPSWIIEQESELSKAINEHE